MINQWRPDQVLMYSHTMVRNPVELHHLPWFPHQLVFRATLSTLFVHRFLTAQRIRSAVSYKTMVNGGTLPERTRWVRTRAGTPDAFPAPRRSPNWTAIVRCNWYNVKKRCSDGWRRLMGRWCGQRLFEFTSCIHEANSCILLLKLNINLCQQHLTNQLNSLVLSNKIC